jgi:hypothetical protein
MRTARCRPAAWLIVTMSLGACAGTWEALPIGPAIAEEGAIRVTQSDGSRMMLRNPAVEGDSIAGDATQEVCGESFGCAEADVRIRLPIENVSVVEASRFGRQVRQVAVGALAVVAASVWFFFELAGSG